MAKDTRTDLRVLFPYVCTLFITGATSGMGLALARVFLEQGFKVIAVGRSPEKLRHLQHLGALTYELDLTQEADIQEAARQLQIHQPELIYHGAGYTEYGDLATRELDSLLQELRLHLESLVVLLHAFGNLPAKKRVFMGFSSALAYTPAAGMSLYSSAKEAIQTLCRLTDIEMSAKGFRVLCCQAGPVLTAFHQRASQHHYEEKSPLALSPEQAMKQILWQTRKEITSFPIGPMAWIAWIARFCFPFRWTGQILRSQTLSRIKKN
jgi:short-subunit dehydrogenase